MLWKEEKEELNIKKFPLSVPLCLCDAHFYRDFVKENVFLVERTNGKNIVVGFFSDYSLKNTSNKQYLIEIVDA